MSNSDDTIVDNHERDSDTVLNSNSLESIPSLSTEVKPI